MTEDSTMNRANALRSSVASGALLRVVALGGAIAIGSTLPADAARYWSDSDPGYYNQQVLQPRRQQPRARNKAPGKKETQVKDTTVHPQMPLIINVSIAQQKVRIYDANGLFAEAPVSTGMPGHSTPMGVFSVIQKDRYHHSNIYSGAPMPYMQRITWGGVALHEGVLPGHPASHGCIRMPGAFAVKMWGWTKMGARVIVTPGELQPARFAHALLPTMKVVPVPVAAAPAAEEPAIKADKGAPEIKPIEAKLELRSTVGHSDSAKAEEPPMRTAEAARSGNAVMTDATPATSEAPAKADEGKSDTTKADAAKTYAASTHSAKANSAKPDETAQAKPDAASKAEKPVEVADASKPEDRTVVADKPAEASAAEAKPADAAKSAETVKADDKPVEAKPETPKADTAKAKTAKADAPKLEAPKAEAAKPEAPKPETAKADAPRPDAPKADTAKADKPVDPNKSKDQTRVSDKSAKEARQREEQRRGQIAVFISRKDNKLYVRQNFQPLFEVPVTIAPSDRPIGTHVFTAEVDKADSNALRWSVVTVPPSARAAMRDSDEPRASRRQKGKAAPAAVEAKPQPLPNSPAEALDRVTIPPEVMTRISEYMSSGASIIVSDQGIAQGETGEYTDFIIRYY
jgi:lipoprotein-anchoring transpeptidase ErfK/SrfK